MWSAITTLSTLGYLSGTPASRRSAHDALAGLSGTGLADRSGTKDPLWTAHDKFTARCWIRTRETEVSPCSPRTV
jgi:hypothetical protein